jgi:uncharacterized membrane protein
MNLGKTIIILALSVLLSSLVFAQIVPVAVSTVRIDGIGLNEDYSNVLSLERGDQFDITVVLDSAAAAENVEVEVTISGYEYGSISETSSLFDMENETSYVKNFDLVSPSEMDSDYDQLKVRVSARNMEDFSKYYDLKIDSARHQLRISDFSLSPSSETEAARSIIGRIRLKNTGTESQDDVKVTLSVPELNLQDVQYLDELVAEDSDFFEDLMVFIPECTNEGTYTVKAEVSYDEGTRSISAEKTLTVTASDLCTSQENAETVVTVLDSQDVLAGESASYPLTLQNTGSSARTYTISLSGVSSWGIATIDPSNVLVVDGGETKTVFVQVTANEDASGENVFTATISTDGEESQVSLTANVSSSASDSSALRKTLEVALIVLVVILILLGLIIGFRKMNASAEDKDQTYY